MHTLNRIPIIHGDIKPANILLDECCKPKIGDFGLTRIGDYDDADVPLTRVYGTRSYLPTEFLAEKALSTKVDTYSFGVVLLELATGQRAFDANFGYLHERVRKPDRPGSPQMPQLLGDADRNKFTYSVLIHLGKQCTERRATDRPEMERVMTNLEGMNM